MRIYLDTCSYNRPYDDQSQMRICLETQAKLHVQDLIRQGKLELVTSYILEYENRANRSMQKKMTIQAFMEEHTSYYVSNQKEMEIGERAVAIMQTGIKEKDAYHVACAIQAGCSYLITTDDRLLKYITDQIQLVTPGEFIRRMEGERK